MTLPALVPQAPLAQARIPYPAARRGRLAVVDLSRGVALLAMAFYHASWDLGFLRLTPENYALTGPGKASARVIAAGFLVIVGVSLVLAHGEGFRKRAFLRRVAQVAAAALAITAATWWLFPESYVFFGILHCIAAASLLAAPSLRGPVWLGALVAAVLFAAPLLPAPALFDAPALAFLGLGTRVPVTNDYVPLLPWAGFVFAGLTLGRLGLPTLRRRFGAWEPRVPPLRWLAAAGRHSLPIYLLHQPLLLGAASLALLAFGPNRTAEEAPFRRGYEAQCVEAGGLPGACRAAGACLVSRLRGEGLWNAASRDGLTSEDRARAIRLSSACYAEAAGTG